MAVEAGYVEMTVLLLSRGASLAAHNVSRQLQPCHYHSSLQCSLLANIFATIANIFETFYTTIRLSKNSQNSSFCHFLYFKNFLFFPTK